MTRRIAFAATLVALAACEAKTGGGSGGAKVAESGPARGSAGGFSAQMSSELAKAGIGDPPGAPSTAGGASGTTASGTTAGATSGSTGSTGGAAMGSGVTAQPIGAPVTAQPIEPVGATTATPSGSPATAMTATGAVKAPPSRAYVKPAPDIAAIKLDLEPNWERDMGEAGTFSLEVKVPTTDDTRVFSVRYGYEDATAPIDCDQYRTFLEDRGAMKVTLNRQKGGACYIEGTDQAGVVAFRMLTTYGGKRLLCHGSLYKDPASASLGDLRDKVLMQAKKICETLAL